ncbi:hypothetical protein SNE40_019252 [Patella caerulea]|uniref:CCHC-type domain-containing protein n=1 Tax=Patella caerulea TaxID=87958 RepID=A0AAN8PF31_PATCE
MADYIDDVELEEDDIDQSVLRRVVKITVHRNEYVFKGDILAVVSNVIGNNDGVIAVSKRDNNEEWFLTLASERLVKIIIDKGACIFNGKHYYFCDADTSVMNLRIHWVPRYLRDSFLLRVFKKYGVVKSIREEQMMIDNKRVYNGLRLITLNCTAMQVQKVPHMIRTAQGTIRMLITAPGRLPLCLRCNCIGHRSMNCGRNDARGLDVVRGPRFSDVVGGRVDREQQQNDKESSIDSNESMGQSEEGLVSKDEVSSEEGNLEIDLESEVEEGKEGEMGKTGEIPSSSKDLFKGTQDSSVKSSVLPTLNVVKETQVVRTVGEVMANRGGNVRSWEGQLGRMKDILVTSKVSGAANVTGTAKAIGAANGAGNAVKRTAEKEKKEKKGGSKKKKDGSS